MTSRDQNPKPGGAQDGPGESASYATLGLQYAFTIAALTALGWWLDGRLATRPWLLLLGAVIGVVAGFVNLVRAVPAPPPRRPEDPRT